jgi:threonine aldolase
MDGARFFNATVSLGCSLKDLTKGVDILSLGGTKIGLLYGESVIFFDKKLSKNLKYRQKQSMQLPSKMRYISAQFYRLIKDKLWKRSAIHSNSMAILLHNGVKDISGVEVTRSVQSNAVFVKIPLEWNEPLMEITPFYVWDEEINEVRWMCSFATEKSDIEMFIEAVKELSAKIK